MPDMTTASQPLLAADVTFGPRNDKVHVETTTHEFEFGGLSVPSLMQILGLLDGKLTIAELAGKAGVRIEDITVLLQPLLAENAVLDTAAALRTQGGRTFFEAFRTECQFWTRPVFAQPFWRRILDGKASRELVLGWGVEFFHFVDAANEYMAAGVAHCREDVVIREWCSRHFIEEAEHSEIFLDGLAKCGLDPTSIRDSRPLPSTRALINFLTEAAIEGAVPYLAAFGVMQPSTEPPDSARVGAFYEHLAGRYGFARPLFEAFCKHALIDVELEHQQTVIERVCSSRLEWPGPAAARAAEMARRLAEYFSLYFEGILDFYSQPGAQLPRRPVRLVALRRG